MTVYFGADWHLYHKKVLEFSNRPFLTIDDMKDYFIHEYLSKVKRNDTVYLLGDISFSNKAIIDLKDLPGYKVLIKGNHDPKGFSNKLNGIWDEVYDYRKIHSERGRKLILCHFPIESWDGMDKQRSIHLHGHTHNNLSHSISTKFDRIDVGYDATGQALSTLEELLAMQEQGLINERFKRIMNYEL